MAVGAKICGLNSPAAMTAAVTGGAQFVGLVFYPPSPRAVRLTEAAALAALVPSHIKKVGLFVDATDEALQTTVAQVGLDMVQLHSKETPERVAAIAGLVGVPAMKAIAVRDAADLDRAKGYEGVADWLLFDAKPPKEMKNALPGGNAVSFDWSLLRGRRWQRPWMLAGGLDSDNVGEAAKCTGAQWVDVSSGVEDRPGVKNITKIAGFLAVINEIEGK